MHAVIKRLSQGLAKALEIQPEKLGATVDRLTCKPGNYTPLALDDLTTHGLELAWSIGTRDMRSIKLDRPDTNRRCAISIP
jgi:hypothetical protein